VVYLYIIHVLTTGTDVLVQHCVFFLSISGLNTWNSDENHVDLDHELDTITDCAPPGEEARGGESKLVTLVVTGRGRECKFLTLLVLDRGGQGVSANSYTYYFLKRLVGMDANV
jgi:hypothetical protein